MTHPYDVLIIGAGQAGLSVAYYLRRSGLSTLLIDAEKDPGGSWAHTWGSLTLFSPARISSLPGWQLPNPGSHYPTPSDIIAYFDAYEQRYGFEIRRPVRAVRTEGTGPFRTTLDDSSIIESTWVVNATGNASRPFVPTLPGQQNFTGQQLHSRYYRGPEPFEGRKVCVVGGGNSGAQIAADICRTTELTWCTTKPPAYLPDHYDGEELFSVASKHVKAGGAEDKAPSVADLGDIVVVPPVKAARDEGLLTPTAMFKEFTQSGVRWDDDSERSLDAVIWCTGFRPALRHLAGYQLGQPPQLNNMYSVEVPGLFFVGYGDWVGPAADTIVGVSPYARAVARTITEN